MRLFIGKGEICTAENRIEVVHPDGIGPVPPVVGKPVSMPLEALRVTLGIRASAEMAKTAIYEVFRKSFE
jgi:hypothetical protein